MRIESFHEFIVLCETMNFTKAAKRLYITQPVLSTHINALEKTLGVPLLSRDQHRIRLTEYGRIFLKHAQTIYGQYGDLLNEIEQTGSAVSASLNLGYLHNEYKPMIAFLYEGLRNANPDIKINLHAEGYRELMDLLNNRVVDAALTIDCDSDLYDSCEIVNLGQEPLLLAVNKNHALAAKPYIACNELESVCLIFPDAQATGRYEEYLTTLFQRNGVKANISERFSDVFSRNAALQNNEFGAIVMEHFAKNLDSDLVTIPIVGGEWSINRCLIWKKSNSNPAIKTACELAKKFYSE